MFEKLKISISTFRVAHKFIWKNNLGGWVVVPGLINAALFVGFMVWIGFYLTPMVDELLVPDCSDYTDSFWENIGIWFCKAWYWFLDWFGWFIKLLVYCLAFLVYFFIYKFVILFIYSPILSFLIERVDQIHTGREEKFNLQQLFKDIVRGITISIRNLLLEGLCIGVLFIISFIPIVNFFQPIMAFVVSGYFLGFSMMDYALERERMNVKSSVSFIKNNKIVAVGNGSVFQLIYLIPIIGWMIAPTYSAVAAYFAVDKLKQSAVANIE